MKVSKKSPKKKVKPNKSGLTGYLVVWRHGMDDIPIGLFADEAEAIRVAKKTSFSAGYKICERLEISCGTPVCFGYVPFTKGVPQEYVIVDRDDNA